MSETGTVTYAYDVTAGREVAPTVAGGGDVREQTPQEVIDALKSTIDALQAYIVELHRRIDELERNTGQRATRNRIQYEPAPENIITPPPTRLRFDEYAIPRVSPFFGQGEIREDSDEVHQISDDEKEERKKKAYVVAQANAYATQDVQAARVVAQADGQVLHAAEQAMQDYANQLRRR